MTDKVYGADDGAMRSSANALTKKLYSTVLDVFGSYAGNDEDDYNTMMETLRQKQMQKCKVSMPVKSSDIRGSIAQKLMEGYVLHGEVCDKCVMPLMSYEGRVSCVLCSKVNGLSKTEKASLSKSSSNFELGLASTTESDTSEDLVNKELFQFNERRSQASHVYAAKILAGCTMQDKLCSTCDMPMMLDRDSGSIRCVFCPKEAQDEISAPTIENTKKAPGNIIKEVATNDAAGPNLSEASKPARKVSQEEIIAERLGVMQFSHGGNTESELEKAESELLKIVGALGMQSNQSGKFDETLKNFFTKKKEERAARKTLGKHENIIVEAEAPTASEEKTTSDISHAVRACNKPTVAPVLDEREHLSFEHGVDHRFAPATPKFESSISCSIGGCFLPSIRNMFASASDPMKAKKEDIYCDMTNPIDVHRETKKRIAALANDGWEVSHDCCPQCDLPLFSNSNGQIRHMKRCVMCGPVAENVNNKYCEQDDTHNVVDQHKKAQEDFTNPAQHSMNRMHNKLKVEVASEPAYTTLPDPTTSMYELRGQSKGRAIDPTPSMQTLKFKINVNQQTVDEPTPAAKTVWERLSEPTPNMQTVRSKLSISTPSDPTPSMKTLRAKKCVDPTPSMKVFKDKLNVETAGEHVKYIGNEPTPAAHNTVRFKLDEPTPNMHAVRNKLNEP